MKEQKTKIYFRIAGHLIGIYWPEHLDIRSCLPSFKDFLAEGSAEHKNIIWVEVRTSGLEADQQEKRLLSDVSAQWGDRFRFEESAHAYITSVQSEGRERLWEMQSTKDFRESVIYAVADELPGSTILSWMLMVVYGQAVVQHKTVLIHASVIKNGSKGFVFLGKSGTGKSTHSRLWLKHIIGSALLNDDNPVIRINELGKVFIYGSPWSGKTPCYFNVGLELAGMVRLRQAKENRWTRTVEKEALFTLLPSCTSIRWNKKLFGKMVDVVEEVASKVQVAYLDCLPDKAAAYLCCQQLTESHSIAQQS